MNEAEHIKDLEVIYDRWLQLLYEETDTKRMENILAHMEKLDKSIDRLMRLDNDSK